MTHCCSSAPETATHRRRGTRSCSGGSAITSARLRARLRSLGFSNGVRGLSAVLASLEQPHRSFQSGDSGAKLNQPQLPNARRKVISHALELNARIQSTCLHRGALHRKLGMELTAKLRGQGLKARTKRLLGGKLLGLRRSGAERLGRVGRRGLLLVSSSAPGTPSDLGTQLYGGCRSLRHILGQAADISKRPAPISPLLRQVLCKALHLLAGRGQGHAQRGDICTAGGSLTLLRRARKRRRHKLIQHACGLQSLLHSRHS
mmetsp:Transcript_108537/g.231784  ORF Transcript_108537/g.231784 Transcript_108537/m.231784 type:complete len:261 (-) Transcript_108537:956-1738(-)